VTWNKQKKRLSNQSQNELYFCSFVKVIYNGSSFISSTTRIFYVKAYEIANTKENIPSEKKRVGIRFDMKLFKMACRNSISLLVYNSRQ